MAIDDLYTRGIAGGWDVRDGTRLDKDLVLEADVAIVGSGAGGGTAAEVLAQAGLRVVMLEEGPLRTAADFKDLDERRAYLDLYQEGAGRTSADGAIGILQGRAVGGTTVVNWTTSLRTPDPTLRHWAEAYGVRETGTDQMQPWFERAEQRLGIAPWTVPPNENNALLQRGCEALGWEWRPIPRNVKGCWNLGYCGLGCPVNAKQSMLVTTLPAALSHGMVLLHHVRAERLLIERDRVRGIMAVALDAQGQPRPMQVQVRARHYVLAGGALNTPALLLRSEAPDPHARVGQRTCIHPVNVSIARFEQEVAGYHGAPQSVYSDQFLWPEGVTGPMGYKLEVPPIQPFLTSATFGTFGSRLAADMAALPHTHVLIALMRDGFHPDSPGGRVRLDDRGGPVLEYEVSAHLWDGLRRAFLSMVEAQFAAGAKEVQVGHLHAPVWTNWSEARRAIPDLAYRAQAVALFTAHLMGGCAMGENPRDSVVDSHGRYHGLENLSVFDGSVFPTSIGANPQLSIYALTLRNATRLAQGLRSTT